jgi:Helix-turn-helix domain of resolvase
MAGRPSTTQHIDIDEVKAMRLEGSNWTKIAIAYDVTTQSLKRALDTLGFVDPIVRIPDDDLDLIILTYLRLRLIGRGETDIMGNLIGLGLRIPRDQMRASIARVDPDGKENRQRRPIKRKCILWMDPIISGI